MTNEQLLVFSQIATELYNARRDLTQERERADKAAHDAGDALMKLDAANANTAAKEKSISALTQERQRYCDRIAMLKAERDSAQGKLGALARTVNLLCGWEKTRRPRVFLRELEAAVRKCIAVNDIRLIEDGMAK